MTSRLLIVDTDPQYAEWLRHHLGVLCADARVRVMTPDQFDVLRESISFDEFDLVLLTSNYGEHPEDPRAEGGVFSRVSGLLRDLSEGVQIR